jgi:two-component system, NarL family, response regulator DegU
MNDEITIIIADDHPIVRQGLRQVIESDPALKIIAEAGDGQTALAEIQRHHPQVVVLDIDMPQMDGFKVAEAMRQQKIPGAIIFLTVHREEVFMKKALSVGAMGYVLKDSAITDIAEGIRTVHRGQNYISPAMVAYLVKQPSSSNVKEGLESLTPAERNVLKLIAQYKTTKEIAEALFISARTVETHRSNICQKLNLRGSHSLMKYALEHLSEVEAD